MIHAAPAQARWILASSSPVRQSILALLGYPFTVLSPDIDETPLPQETPEAMVQRLAYAKAEAVWDKKNGLSQPPSPTVIIAADTTASCDGRIYGKPETSERAMRYLQQMSGKRVVFYTGLCLWIEGHAPQVTQDHVAVDFRILDDTMIAHYLAAEQPYQLSGGFKSEGMGAILAERYIGTDPHTIKGLPLMQLTTWLRAAGWVCPGPLPPHLCFPQRPQASHAATRAGAAFDCQEHR